MLQLSPTGSHLYPGATGDASGDGPDVVVAFADLSRTTGRLAGDSLVTHPYETSAGTRIPAKAWRVEIRDGRFRILARDLSGTDAIPT